ncbi:molecular chaperone DnaK [filamentous cyanobacterium CCP5]|nr:molecular chaperone DnaK [filamentous cyanobacterium CCP5]
MTAIDFGTSNTVIARWNGAIEKPETLTIPGYSTRYANSPPVIPSLLYLEQVEPLKVLIGQQVRDQGRDVASDPRFFRNFKRGIGTPIQGFLPEVAGAPLSFEQVGRWYLHQLLEQVQASHGLEDLIFTVPVDSFEAYRSWLGDICQSFAAEQVRLLDEPTAAALGYGIDGDRSVLVVDFGGGTLDFSLVQLRVPAQQKPLGFILKWGNRAMADSAQKVETAQVLAKAGENLGGADIDTWLVNYFQEAQALPLSPVTLRLAERLKIQLSSQTQGVETYFDDETLAAYELSLTRLQFEKILEQHQLFERLENRLTQVLSQGRRQGVAPEDIDAVLAVGGTAQIPAIQDWLRQRFGARVRCDRPFEAIAQGALQLSQVDLKDFLYHSYGIRYWDRRQNCHGWHPIILQGQPYPMTTPIELTLGASVEKQPSVELVIGELGDDTSRTEVYFEGDQLITRQISSGAVTVQPLNDREGARTVAQLSPPGFPGSDRIRVLFRVDRDRLLRITVEDILTGDTLLTNQPVVELQ